VTVPFFPLQKQGRNAWLAALSAALVLGVLFLSSSVHVSIPKTVTVPGLPGTGVSLADALGKADIMVVGQVVDVKYEGTDSMTDRYRVKINVTRRVMGLYGTLIGPITLEGEVRILNSAFGVNIVSGDDVIPMVRETIPEDGRNYLWNYLFFISTNKNTGSNLTIFKMVPGGIVVPSAIPEFPEKLQTLEDILTDSHNNIVIGQFVKIRPRFERAIVEGPKINWEQDYKAVINVKKTVRGEVTPGLIEGDIAYSGSGNLDAGIGPMPTTPDMGRDYMFFLSIPGPSENVNERLTDPDYIFYLSPGRPAETSCNINKILPTDPLAETKTPVAAPTSAIVPKSSLPLPGSALSLDAAEVQAQTIVLGRLVEMSAFCDNAPVYNQFDTIEILKTLRGKAHGTIQYGVPVNLGKESALDVGKEYLFFLSHYGAVLKIAPADALSELPPPAPGTTHSP
jgi:hypothetical protein